MSVSPAGLEAISPDSRESSFPARARMAYRIVRFAAATLLLLAALAKLESFLGGRSSELALSSWPVLHVLHVQAEVFLAVWLLIGALPRSLWLATWTCFLAYASVAAYKVLTGAATCGCFGAVEVSPWLVLVLDGAVLAGLVYTRPDFWAPGPRGELRRLAIPAVAALLVGGLGGAALSRYQRDGQPQALDAAEGQIVVLQPEEWVGQRFPLLDRLDLGSQLAVGNWRVLLFYQDCEHCQLMVRQIEEESRGNSDQQVCLIEMPPYSTEPVPRAPHVKFARLRGNTRWFVAAPAEVILSGGRVISGRSSIHAGG